VDPEARPRDERLRLFEEMHKRGEPFDYSRRAAEQLRHSFVREVAARLTPPPARLLDVGCSMGQLTAQLASVPRAVFAIDLSRVAISEARSRVRGARFVVAGVTALPFRAGAFDLVVLADGLHSWKLSPRERGAALGEAHRVVGAGGFALLTEYLQPQVFPAFVAQVRASAFEVVSVAYLYDRLWYRIESWLKAVRGWRGVQRLLASVPFALFLRSLSRRFGASGSRHVCVVARKACAARPSGLKSP